MRLGIDNLLKKNRDLISGRRIGILAHAASIDAEGAHTIDRISKEGGCKITALFGPEHGLETVAQDMEAVGDSTDPLRGIPVYSLYGDTLDSLKPTPQMLSNLDAIVIDLQDIGSRYYTYIWTASLCAEACAEAGKSVIICDRPNPIGGTLVEGGAIEEGFESFVGLHSIPVRHGMTIGEIVQMLNVHGRIGADMEVIRMDGWKRWMNFKETKIPWTNPSPNMRSYTAALLYPGMCLIEGTNISEGRGTDTPFEIVGAPYINSDALISAFKGLGLRGVHLAPTSFIPTRQKWRSKLCHGVRFVIEDVSTFRPYLTGLAIVWLIRSLYVDTGFEWRDSPYEFVATRPAIDILTGSSAFREKIDALTIDDLKEMAATPESMLDERHEHLIY